MSDQPCAAPNETPCDSHVRRGCSESPGRLHPAARALEAVEGVTAPKDTPAEEAVVAVKVGRRRRRRPAP